MLYLIGLGLNEKSLSQQALEICTKSELYLEGYTVDFPYSLETLEKEIGKKIQILGREKVENFSFLKQAKEKDVTLLIYGSPLFATTHISILEEAKKQNIPVKIIYNASIFDALGETGLQLYKFGKIASMPKWQKSFQPTSFLDIVKENQSIKAHSLILVDIGLEFPEALKQLEEAAKEKELKLDKIVVCSKMGTGDSKIVYSSIEKLNELKVDKPYCLIIPSELHFVEKEMLEKS